MSQEIRILLVEDNPMNIRVVTSIIEGSGVTVDSVTNGDGALSALKEKTYDAVLMDIHMPVMDGIEATGIIRNKLKLTGLPIIALTAYTMKRDRKKYIDAGMNNLVSKPVIPQDLFAVLRKHIPRFEFIPENETVQLRKNSDQNLTYPDFLPGLDIAGAIERIGVSFEMYTEFLKDYREYYKDFSAEFRELIEKNDFKALRLKAHGIKGAAGNISAFNLHSAAEALEHACLKEYKEEIPGLFLKVEERLKEVLTSSEKIIGRTDMV
jgi:two-component system, sensor histidine kinase and response regulator